MVVRLVYRYSHSYQHPRALVGHRFSLSSSTATRAFSSSLVTQMKVLGYQCRLRTIVIYNHILSLGGGAHLQWGPNCSYQPDNKKMENLKQIIGSVIKDWTSASRLQRKENQVLWKDRDACDQIAPFQPASCFLSNAAVTPGHSMELGI